MTVVELTDREQIAAFCRRRPAVHAYALGDLDDFFWPHTRWFALVDGGSIQELVLLYDEPDPPVVLALAETGEAILAALLGELSALLPQRLYAHVTASCLGTLTGTREVGGEASQHLKLGLVDPARVRGVALERCELLGPADLEDLLAFYADAYPGTWFHPRMLETGRYAGVRREGRLAAVAGVHVWSPRWSVACLGNVATLPSHRGQGLSRTVCAFLCERLLDDGIDTIGLNVRADNHAALAVYERLGFEPVAEYLEVSLVPRPAL